MKLPKLLFYINDAYPLFAKTSHSFGGAEINLYYLSREFVRRGYEVEFLVADYNQSPADVYEGVLVKKIKYFALQKYTGLHHKILRRYNFIKLLWKSDADIYILSTANEMTGYATFVATLKNKKTIFRVAHDWDVDKTFTRLSNFLGFMYRYALPRFDVIVSQTVAQKKMLLDNEGLNSTVIANGFPLDERHTDVDKDCVLWVGRDDPVKRPMLFIELARRLPDFKCIMIMQGNGELKDKVISETEMTPGLELIDHVGFFEIQHYFDMAICLVNTSEKEGFSNAFIQACISSVPILSYRVNPDKVLTENKIGAVCNDSVEVAAEFIMSLCSNSLKDYGRNAYNYVKEKHDLQDRADEYESLIKDLVRCVE